MNPDRSDAVVNLVKLCVGCDTVEELLSWRQSALSAAEPWIMRTRRTPRRAAELVRGGSLYRVFKGFILSRQVIERVDTVGEGPAARCEVTLGESVILTLPTPRRAFQGWRYLEEGDAPRDLEVGWAEAPIPPGLARRLLEAGVW